MNPMGVAVVIGLLCTIVNAETVGMPPLSTHILDTAKGLPVGGVDVTLYVLNDNDWNVHSIGQTNNDGRCDTFFTSSSNLTVGSYKLYFDVAAYFKRDGVESLYPFIEVPFIVRPTTDRLHIPLLLSPFGYTTYRGS